jgi:two-component system, NarL family, sensor histidine kinase UhpB
MAANLIRALLLCSGLFVCCNASAQTPIRKVPGTLDSLRIFLRTQPVDTLYAQAMKDCAFEYIIQGDNDRADSLRQELEKLKPKLPNSRIPYYIPFIKATLAYHQNDQRGCLQNFLIALRYMNSHPSLFNPTNREGALNNVSAGYARVNKPDSALYYALEAIHVQEQYHVANAVPHQRIADVLSGYRKYTEAIPYYEKALAINHTTNNVRGIGITENKLGILYDNMGKSREAIEHFTRGLQYAEQTNYALLQTDLLVNLGKMMVTEKRYPEAEDYFQRGERLSRSLHNLGALRVNLLNQAELYHARHDYKRSETYYKESLALADTLQHRDGLHSARRSLADLYMDTGDYKKACEFFIQASIDKDSLFAASTNDKVQELLAQYEAEKKQQQIALLNEQNLVQQLELSVQRRNLVLLLVGLIALAVAGIVLYRRNKRKSQQEMEQIRSSIAADFHDELGANLSSIALYSDLLLQTHTATETTRATPLLENIHQNARNTLSSISDLIWTIKPDHDVLEGTLVRMKEFSIPLLEAKGIDFDFHIDESLRQANLDMTVRKILYLVFKEAINNAVKYAQATRISVQLTQANRKITLEVSDNGKGFDPATIRRGNGLNNMQKRAAEIDGLCTIEARPDGGCTVRLVLRRL